MKTIGSRKRIELELGKKKTKLKTIPCILAESCFKALGLKFIEEFKFHSERKWRADYYIPSLNLLIEVEGGLFCSFGGRHNRASGYMKDLVKYREAEIKGFKLLRYSTNEINETSGQVILDDLKRLIA